MSRPPTEPSEVLVVRDLQLDVDEAREALSAIRAGQVDALVIRQSHGQAQEVVLLQGAEQAYQVLYETLNEGAVTLAADGMILFTNQRFAQLCAVPLAEVRGTPISRFVAPDDVEALSALLEAAIRGSCKGELRLRRSDGTTLPVMVSMRRVDLPHTLVTAVVSDLSQIKQAQAELLRSHARLAEAIESLRAEVARREQLEAALREKAEALLAADRRKDEFLAMLAHELRNPLVPIRNAAELLREPLATSPELERHRLVIERQTQHMARLVNDLLEVSRLTHGTIQLQKSVVDLSSLVRTALEDTQPLLEQHGHAVTLTLPLAPVWIEADSTRIQQVMLNLLKNAAEYTRRGGRVEVVVESGEGLARVSVRDNGMGIEPTLLPHVFDLFVQGERPLARSQGGLGLGLNVVKRLVEQHGGAVRAESTGPGRGSVFTIELPLARRSEAEPAKAAAPTNSPREAVSALRVLVIEDNVDAAETLCDVVGSWGHEVAVAYSGEAGLREAETFRPDVVLVDIGLPGIDGYEVARRLRAAEPPRRHLICMSGYGKPRDRERAQEAGFDGFMVKPLEPAPLREALAEASRCGRV